MTVGLGLSVAAVRTVFGRRAECAVRAIGVVVVLAFLESRFKEPGVVEDLALEEAVELLGVDAVRSLHLAVEARCSPPDSGVADALVDQIPVERGSELLAVEFLRDVKRLQVA